MRGYFVYKFFNNRDEVIYIGKTVALENRIKTHFSVNGHLPAICYKETKDIYYTKFENNDEMSIYERYLINLHNPKYNTQFNNNTDFGFTLPDLEWTKYDFEHRTIKESESKKFTIMDLYNEYGLASIETIVEFNVRKYILLNRVELNKKSHLKKLVCIDPYTKECVGLFENTKDASSFANAHFGNIYKAARKGNTCGGYWWKYLYEILNDSGNRSTDDTHAKEALPCESASGQYVSST